MSADLNTVHGTNPGYLHRILYVQCIALLHQRSTSRSQRIDKRLIQWNFRSRCMDLFGVDPSQMHDALARTLVRDRLILRPTGGSARDHEIL